jgi:hypothetical protein
LSSRWRAKTPSARTALGHCLISLRKACWSIATWGYQRQTRLPISQRLKICSTSDSEESGSLTFFSGYADPDFEGGKEAYKEISAIFFRRGLDEDGFE